MNNFDDWSQIISKYLKSESDPLGSLTKHELEGDAARTAFIRAVLDRFLPEIYGVGSGQVMDSKGKTSGKMDIIIYRRDFPRLDLPGSRDIYLYESVIATVEVVAKLVKKTFFDALDQCASLAELTPDIDAKVMTGLAARNQLTLNENNEYMHPDALRTGRFNLIARPLSFIYAFSGYKTSSKQLGETIESWMQDRDEQNKPVDLKSLPAVIATQGCFAWRNSAPMTLTENSLMGIGVDQAPVRLIVLQMLHALSRRLRVTTDSFGLKPGLDSYLNRMPPPKMEAYIGDPQNPPKVESEKSASLSTPMTKPEVSIPEPKPRPTAQSKPVSTPAAEPRPVGQSKPEPTTESRSVAQSKPEPTAEFRPVAQSKPEPIPIAKPRPVTLSKPEPTTESRPLAAENKPVAVAESKPVLKPVPAVEPKPAAVTESKPASLAERKPRTAAPEPVKAVETKPAPTPVQTQTTVNAEKAPIEQKSAPIETKPTPVPPPVAASSAAATPEKPVIEIRPTPSSVPPLAPQQTAAADSSLSPEKPAAPKTLPSFHSNSEEVDAPFPVPNADLIPELDPDPPALTVETPVPSFAKTEKPQSEKPKPAPAPVAKPAAKLNGGAQASKPKVDIELQPSPKPKPEPVAAVDSADFLETVKLKMPIPEARPKTNGASSNTSVEDFMETVKMNMASPEPFSDLEPKSDSKNEPFTSTIPQ